MIFTRSWRWIHGRYCLPEPIRPAQSKLERRLNVRQRAAGPTQDDPGAQQSHPHAKRLG